MQTTLKNFPISKVFMKYSRKHNLLLFILSTASNFKMGKKYLLEPTFDKSVGVKNLVIVFRMRDSKKMIADLLVFDLKNFVFLLLSKWKVTGSF